MPGFLAVYPHAGAAARASLCDPPGAPAPNGTPPLETWWVGAVSQPLYFSGDCSGGEVGVRNVTGVRSTNLHGAFGSSCVRLESDPPTSLLLNFSCGANDVEDLGNDGEELAHSVVEQLLCASGDCSGVCALQVSATSPSESCLSISRPRSSSTRLSWKARPPLRSSSTLNPNPTPYTVRDSPLGEERACRSALRAGRAWPALCVGEQPPGLEPPFARSSPSFHRHSPPRIEVLNPRA